jgi:hypothetical protein
MLSSRLGRTLASCLGIAGVLACASDFSTGDGKSGGAAGTSLGGQGAGSGGTLEAGQGGSASDAGEQNAGGSAGSIGGSSGDAGESSEGGAAGSRGGSGQRGGRSGSGGLPSGGVPSLAGTTGEGGVANAAGLANLGGMGNHEPVSNDALVYWFSADFGVIETNGAVDQWLDRSGNEADASQIIPDSRPQLDKFSGSELPAIVFDGVDDYFGMPPLLTGFDAGVTFFAVARITAGDGCRAILELSNGTEIDDVSFFRDLEAFTYEVTTDVLHGQQGAFALGEPRLVEVTHALNGQVSLFLNGLATGAGVFALPFATTRNQNFLGRSLYMNCSTWSGELAEILLYSRVLPTDERQAVESYLNDKWGCCSN